MRPVVAALPQAATWFADIVGAADPLHRLDDDGRRIPVDDFSTAAGCHAAQTHIKGYVENRTFSRAPGDGAGGRGSAMPSLFQRDDLPAGQFERKLRAFSLAPRAVDPEDGSRPSPRIRQRRGALANDHGRALVWNAFAGLALERRSQRGCPLAQAATAYRLEIQNLARRGIQHTPSPWPRRLDIARKPAQGVRSKFLPWRRRRPVSPLRRSQGCIGRHVTA